MRIIKTTSRASAINWRILILVAASIFLLPARAEPPTTQPANQLKNHPSPYLALHGNDPVDWQDWGAHVIERARRENKLIFVSSGYFSCHWCHVMQRESFSDPQVAARLNTMAISVKIDRELQPALDSWLIHFTETTSGQAGWPLNVFLTPDGYPLLGMTYLPKDNFYSMLGELNDLWKEDQDQLEATALAAFESIQPKASVHSGKLPQAGMDKALAELLIRQALEYGDEIAGGFGDQNKFPMSPQLNALVEIQAAFPDEQLASFLRLTLDQMAQLGLRDHVGGGFFRYTVDPAWDIPHFEKMLYDNAQLASVYIKAARVLNEPRYLEVALDTLNFVLTDMQDPSGAYVASLSAVDDKDIEGGYYLWQVDELQSFMTRDEFEVVRAIWGTSGAPYLEAGHHLKFVAKPDDVAGQMNIPVSEINSRLEQSRLKLLKQRQQRKLPVDNKVLAAWNGLLLTSLSQAVSTTDNPRYRTAADKLYQVLSTQFWNGEQLSRFLHNGRPGGRVSLADYAYVSQGIAAWAAASGDTQAWSIARQIALAGLQRFHNPQGWQLSETLIIPYNARELVLSDQTMASPSAVLLNVLHRVAQNEQDDGLLKSILPYIDIDLAETASAPLWYGSHILLIHRVLQTAG
jgi:uncharacterized protein YyaL (SSP411 family)